jgi:predicted kinase
MPKLYIMCGIAFSGKSTLARRIANATGCKIIAFDKLWVEKDKEKPVPKDAEGWRFIRKVGQDKVEKALKQGSSVVYDDNNVRFEHREELRKIARRLGVREITVYLNTPIEAVREREASNKTTGERHEVEPNNFQTVLEQLEVPTQKENVMEFRPEMDIDNWLRTLENRF